jgi:hypothetical protein
LAAKFEEEARLLEEEARFLEEEAKRYLEQAHQKKEEVQQEMLAAISEGSDTEAVPVSRTASARWADIEDQEDQWDDEAALTIMGNVGVTQADDAPMVCADFLNFGSCPRGASCPWQHVTILEEDDCEELKGAVQKGAEEVLYKRGMLYPTLSPKAKA